MTVTEPINIITTLTAASDKGADIWEASISAGISANTDMDNRRSGSARREALPRRPTRPVCQRNSHECEPGTGVSRGLSVLGSGKVRTREVSCGAADGVLQPLPGSGTPEGHAKAEAFIQECADGDWTAERARVVVNERMGKPVPPKKLVDTETVPAPADETLIGFEMLPEVREQLLNYWRDNRRVRVVVYEVLDVE